MARHAIAPTVPPPGATTGSGERFRSPEERRDSGGITQFELLEQFSSYQAGRGFSAKTVRRRSAALRGFCAYVSPVDVRDATTADVEAWVMHHHRASSPATRHAYRSDLMMFYRWANKRHIFEGNPVADTDSVRKPKHLPRPLPAEQLERANAGADDDMRLMIALGAYAGLRCAEIAALEADDVTVLGDNPVLVVRDGKGGKDRVVPLHPHLAELLAPRVRQPGRVVERSAASVSVAIGRHLRACGVDSTAHKLRHTFGTEAARATNGNLVLVAYLMGHESVQTTMGYIGWDGGAGRSAIDAMFPAATS